MCLVVTRLGDSLLPIGIPALIQCGCIYAGKGGCCFEEARRVAEKIKVFGILRGGYGARVVYLEVAVVALACRDENHAVCTAGTIDGGGGGIFQEVKGDDVRRGDGAQ